MPKQTPEHDYDIFVLLKRLLQVVEWDTDRTSRNLHTAMCRYIRWTDKVEASNEALAAHRSNLGGQSRRRHSKNGGEARSKNNA